MGPKKRVNGQLLCKMNIKLMRHVFNNPQRAAIEKAGHLEGFGFGERERLRSGTHPHKKETCVTARKS